MSEKMRVGELRPSQIMHAYGIGSIVDLEKFSGIVMGLQDWDPPRPPDVVQEPRLLGLVRTHLGPQVQHLVLPPAASDDAADPLSPEARRGLPITTFPRWVRCPVCDLIAPLDFGVFQLEHDAWRPDATRYVHANCQKSKGRPPAVLPVRFVRACEKGHLDDFPWVEFVHGGPTKCAALLRLYEFGVSAEAADIVVKCETCNVSQPMSQAFGEAGKKKLGACTGRFPHLRSEAPCQETAKAMLSGASNIWFSMTASAITIPSGRGRIDAAIEEHWAQLAPITSRDILAAFRAAGHLQTFDEWALEDIFSAIERKRSGGEAPSVQGLRELKTDEWHALVRGGSEGADFLVTNAEVPGSWATWLEQVGLVQRLRVVNAFLGFTRIVSPGDYADVDEVPNRASIDRSRPTWVPASEMRGEGLFLRFREDAITAWLRQPAVRERDAVFHDAHVRFRRARRIANAELAYPGLRYVLLHSLSHALLRQLAIECGYSAASIRERIYAAEGAEPMAGILLYTAAPDSEGTLGGLVDLGKPEHLDRHLRAAVRGLALCASDPLCSEHPPGGEPPSLHGAACHACMFASETSCERGNKYLDRTLLVQTFGGPDGVPFFDAEVGATDFGES